MDIRTILTHKWVLFLIGVGLIWATLWLQNNSRPQGQIFTVLPSDRPIPLNNIIDTKEHVLLAAGDIADCGSNFDESTVQILATLPGTIAALGDLAYPNGSPQEFNNCFGASWGRFKDRIKPAIGNHEYHTKNASGYFSYFGAQAGDPNKGYYRYQLGDWQIFVLNSNCSSAGCNEKSAQYVWLKSELATNPSMCSLAYMHHPYYSSGRYHGSSSELKPLWQLLFDAGVEVVLSGHEHQYERFAPQTPDGKKDMDRGVRQFVVGTGGKSLYGFGRVKPNSELRNSATYGVLRLGLLPNSYTWQFVPIHGQSFTDSGSNACHK